MHYLVLVCRSSNGRTQRLPLGLGLRGALGQLPFQILPKDVTRERGWLPSLNKCFRLFSMELGSLPQSWSFFLIQSWQLCQKHPNI